MPMKSMTSARSLCIRLSRLSSSSLGLSPTLPRISVCGLCHWLTPNYQRCSCKRQSAGVSPHPISLLSCSATGSSSTSPSELSCVWTRWSVSFTRYDFSGWNSRTSSTKLTAGNSSHYHFQVGWRVSVSYSNETETPGIVIYRHIIYNFKLMCKCSQIANINSSRN